MKGKVVGVIISLVISFWVEGKEVIRFSPEEEDMTLVVKKALENNNDKNLKLIFEKGTYRFLPDYAFEKYCFVTNHENGFKKIIFPMEMGLILYFEVK